MQPAKKTEVVPSQRMTNEIAEKRRVCEKTRQTRGNLE